MPLTLSSISSSITASTLGPAGDRSRSSRAGETGAAATETLRSRNESSLDNATRQVAQETASAKVRLSSIGRVRSAFAEARDAARAVQPPAEANAAPRSANELREQATRLVNGVNNAVRVSNEVARPERGQAPNSTPTEANVGRPNTPRNAAAQSAAVDTGDRARGSNSSTRGAAPTPEQQRVQQAATALNRAIGNAGPTRADNTQALARIGITVARDGQINLDRSRFDAAVTADRSAVEQTLGQLGQRVETNATVQLSEPGNLGKASATATVRVDRAETRQNQLEEAQKVVQQRSEVLQNVNQTNNPFLVGGVTAYRGVFSL